MIILEKCFSRQKSLLYMEMWDKSEREGYKKFLDYKFQNSLFIYNPKTKKTSVWYDNLEIEKESKIWLQNIFDNYNERESFLESIEFEKIGKKLENLLEKYKAVIDIEQGYLIHGDILNPGNILGGKGKLTGIVDWEWSISGDPAWEFVFGENEIMEKYFSFAGLNDKEKQKEFRLKIKIYRIFWLLWGTNVHVKGGTLKNILYKEFKKELNNFK